MTEPSDRGAPPSSPPVFDDSFEESYYRPMPAKGESDDEGAPPSAPDDSFEESYCRPTAEEAGGSDDSFEISFARPPGDPVSTFKPDPELIRRVLERPAPVESALSAPPRRSTGRRRSEKKV
jgi:hypothetical protein